MKKTFIIETKERSTIQRQYLVEVEVRDGMTEDEMHEAAENEFDDGHHKLIGTGRDGDGIEKIEEIYEN
jgi:hypothetical protein